MAPSWRTRSEAPKGRAARGSVSPRKVACRATLRGGRLERSKATGSRTGASPVAALTIEPCDMLNGTDMTPHIPENFSKVVRRRAKKKPRIRRELQPGYSSVEPASPKIPWPGDRSSA